MTAANVRSARQVALLLQTQSAKGSPATDLSNAKQVWTLDPRIPVTPIKSADEMWMAETHAPAPVEMFSICDQPRGRIVAAATPDVMDLLLRSNYGPPSGGEYELKTQVNQWLTIGWVEHAASGNVGKIVRIQDAWVDRLELRAMFPRGYLVAIADFIGRKILPTVKGSGGISVPGSFNPERNPFTFNGAGFIQDPDGSPVAIRIRELRVILEQVAAEQEWDMGDLLVRALKAGPARPAIEARFEVSDESWRLIDDSRSDTKRDFSFAVQAQSPVKTFEMRLNQMDFAFEDLGHIGKDMREVIATGNAHQDNVGKPAEITIS